MLILFYESYNLIVMSFIITLVINILDTIMCYNLYDSNQLFNRFYCLILTYIFLLICTYEFKKLVALMKDIYIKSNIDALTGFHNKVYAREKYNKILEENTDLIFSLVYINLDKFSVFNNQLGHNYGDKVLGIVSNKINENFKEIDFLCDTCRLYGDKFCILIRNRSVSELGIYISQLKKDLNNNIIHKNNLEFPINVSISATDTSYQGYSFDNLLLRCKDLVKESRSNGGNKVLIDNIELQ